jgi:hypothetical protein
MDSRSREPRLEAVVPRGGPVGRGRPSGPTLVALAVGLLTLAVLPVAERTIGRDSGFLPGQLAAVGCLYLIALSLLAAAFLRTGSRRLLAISLAYGWAFVVMLGHAAAFPGVVTTGGPLATSPAVVTWLHLFWQVGLPVLLTLAWVVPAVAAEPIPSRLRTRTLTAGFAVAAAFSGAVVAATAAAGPDLPNLVVGVDASRFRHLTAPVAVPLLLVTVLVCWRATRGEQGPARWTTVTVAACAADIFCFYAAGQRYTVAGTRAGCSPSPGRWPSWSGCSRTSPARTPGWTPNGRATGRRWTTCPRG